MRYVLLTVACVAVCALPAGASAASAGRDPTSVPVANGAQRASQINAIPSPRTALLSLAVPSHAGCLVVLDGVSLGHAPLTDAVVRAGDSVLDVHCASGLYLRRNVTLVGGRTCRLVEGSVAPESYVDNLAGLSVSVPNQHDCAVSIDGSPVGVAPFVGVRLGPGLRELTVRCEGGWYLRQSISLHRGRGTRVILWSVSSESPEGVALVR